MHEPFLRYRKHRWLKVGVVVVAAAMGAYVATPAIDRSGASPVGYALGTAAAALMLWLTWFGVRKRSYRIGGAPLRGWLSAHVYLGTALVPLVALHAAFRFGWNVHTLAAFLMLLTVVSGVVGVFLYVSIPDQMTQNRPGETLASLFEQIGSLDAQCRALAECLPTAVAAAVDYSIERTRVGGGVLRQIAGGDPVKPVRRALTVVHRAQSEPTCDPANADALQKLRADLTHKQTLLRRIGVDVRLKARLDAWLVIHVPLAIAALAAVATHVVAVFYFR